MVEGGGLSFLHASSPVPNTLISSGEMGQRTSQRAVDVFPRLKDWTSDFRPRQVVPLLQLGHGNLRNVPDLTPTPWQPLTQREDGIMRYLPPRPSSLPSPYLYACAWHCFPGAYRPPTGTESHTFHRNRHSWSQRQKRALKSVCACVCARACFLACVGVQKNRNTKFCKRL